MSIPPLISAKITAAMCIICTLLGCFAVWYVQELRIDAKTSSLSATHANERAAWDREKTAITTKAQQDTAAALARQKQAQDAAAKNDYESQEKLAHAERENATLRGDVAAGTKRVSILSAKLATAELSARQHAASGSSGGSSVGDAVQIDLSPEGGRAVLDLRESTEKDAAVIEYLQNHIRDVVKQCKP